MKNLPICRCFAAVLLMLIVAFPNAAVLADTGTVTGNGPGQDILSLSVEAAGTRAPDDVEPVYRFTVAWGTVSGSYMNTVTYTWDPVALTHVPGEGNGWTELTAPALSGTIVNRSNAPITVTVTFEASEGIGVEMFGGGEATQAITLPIKSAVSGTPAEMADAAEGDPVRYGTAQEISFEAVFHVTDGFDLLTAEESRIGTATVTVDLGEVEETYTRGGRVVPPGE